VDDVGASNFGEVGSSQDNHLKQNEMRSPAIGQLRMSSLDKGVVTKQKAVLFSWGEEAAPPYCWDADPGEGIPLPLRKLNREPSVPGKAP
jgi:hypothetical protein